MKIKLSDIDIQYEQDIITRFGSSILKSFESLFETQEENDIEIKQLREELHQKDKKLTTVTDIINTDNSLDRIKEFIDQLSSMMLSKNFNSKVDHKALTWLRGLFGEKIHQSFMTDNSSFKKKRGKSKSKRKINDAKLVFSEILEIITTMLDSSQNTSGETKISKLEYIKSRVEIELQKDVNKTIGPLGNQSLFSDTPRSPFTTKNRSHVPFDDNSSLKSNSNYSEFGDEQKYDRFFGKVLDDKLKSHSNDYDYLCMLKIQAQVIENLDDLQKHADEGELPMELTIKHQSNDHMPELSHEPEPTPIASPKPDLISYLYSELSPEADIDPSPVAYSAPQPYPAPEQMPLKINQE
jgi:hypothetical protein